MCPRCVPALFWWGEILALVIWTARAGNILETMNRSQRTTMTPNEIVLA
jgi:hypothetical protein